jgi:hypothetical protein
MQDRESKTSKRNHPAFKNHEGDFVVRQRTMETAR